MKKSSLFVFGVLLLLSISFIGCSSNYAKSKIVGIEWVYTGRITPKTVNESFWQLKLEKASNSISLLVKQKGSEDKTVTGTYTLKGNKLTISFPEKKDDPVLQSVIRSFNKFYQFRVEGDYLILTSSIGMKEINWGFIFVKKDVLKDWAKS